MTLVDLSCDVFVAGGGLAGICAAISAARHGAKVILVQNRSRLGGNSSSEVKMHVVGANSHKGRGVGANPACSKKSASRTLFKIRSAVGRCGTCFCTTR